MRSLGAALVILCLVALPAFGQDDGTPLPYRDQSFTFDYTNEVWTNPALDPMATTVIAPGGTQWSAFHGQWLKGDHQFDIQGGLNTYTDRYAYGELMESGSFSSSITYRYNGLFGGIVRPVARFSAGVGQDFRQLGGGGFGGYGPSGTAFLSPEAGFEFVYRGYGFGITEKFVYAQRYDYYDPSADVTGPAALNPAPNWGDWSEWLTNFYLIVE